MGTPIMGRWMGELCAVAGCDLVQVIGMLLDTSWIQQECYGPLESTGMEQEVELSLMWVSWNAWIYA